MLLMSSATSDPGMKGFALLLRRGEGEQEERVSWLRVFLSVNCNFCARRGTS